VLRVPIAGYKNAQFIIHGYKWESNEGNNDALALFMILKTKSGLTVRNERAWISYCMLSYSLQDSDLGV
jgi:hypothetical protein